MDALETRIPPPVVMLVCALLMGLGAMAAPALAVGIPAPATLGMALATVGLAIDAAGILAFRKAKTTLNPMKPDSASRLVSAGIFGVTRNPMYLGLLLVLAGWAVYLSHALAFAGPVLFVLYMNRFQIGPEERVLAARFGEDYAAYRARVRRWL